MYIEKTEHGSEILYEDIAFVVGPQDTPLSPGFSKTVISKSGKGYKREAAAFIVPLKELRVDLYFDSGQGFVQFDTITVDKKI